MPKGRRDDRKGRTKRSSQVYDESSSLPTIHYRLADRKNARSAKKMLVDAGIKMLLETPTGWIVQATRRQVETLTSARVKETAVTRQMGLFSRGATRYSFEGLPSDAPPPLDS